MRSCNCNCNSCGCDRSGMGVMLSLLAGVAAGIAYFFGILPFISFGIILSTVVALIALILFWVTIISKKPYTETDCVCENFRLLLTGIIGTLVTSFVIFSIIPTPFFIATAILVGLAVFFFGLTLTGIISFLACKAECDDCEAA